MLIFYFYRANYGYLRTVDNGNEHLLARLREYGSMFGGDINDIGVEIDELDNDVLHLRVSKY